MSGIKVISLLLFCFFAVSISSIAKEKSGSKENQGRITIMGLGDSITEGGENFQSFLYPLWERLYTAGYEFDFIGPRICKCRLGTLNHCGFGGKNTEFLEAHIDSIYRIYPADMVLIHSGHNHFDTENPVDGIIEAHQSIIRKILAITPDAKILIAKVIESGKLPKYSYIPELNSRIEEMVKKMHNPDIFLVDQASGFNWQKNTISDKVHPNPEGANRMAQVWFDAIKQLLPEPPQSFLPEILSYKKTEHRDLNLHVFKPEKVQNGEKRPAIVYFFGGGWSVGTPLQFYRECAYYASKGIVTITADYRIAYLDHSKPFESVEDAKDAIRWIRKNAEKWNIDNARIAAAGASAGGHLAATAGILNDKSEERQNSSSKPNLLLLYYPVIDNSEKGYGSDEMKKRYMEISPLHNIRKGVPPALFNVGTEDHLIPVETAQEFKNKMKEAGSYCELHLVEGAGHPIFYYAKDLTADYYTIRSLTDNFLFRYGYLMGK